MTCLGCNLIETAPVTLVNNTIVCTSCEDHRAECEARFVLEMPLIESRREYLRKVEKSRGFEAANGLRDVMKAVWEARRAPQG